MKQTGADLIVRSNRIISGDREINGAVVVRSGIIDGILGPGDITDEMKSLPLEDVGNSVVMSGLIDTHVHIDEPGRTEWEGFETATRAAAAGGITTLVDMPLNSVPPTTSSQALTDKVRRASGRIYVDCGFHGGLVPGSTGNVTSLIENGVFGIKVFLIDSGVPEFRAVTVSELDVVMPIIASAGIPMLVHAELPNRVKSNQSETPKDTDSLPVHSRTDRGDDKNGDSAGLPDREDAAAVRSYSRYQHSRPAQWEVNAVEFVVQLGRRYDCPVHIVHLSAIDALPILRDARQRGQKVTVETCPHYLVFAAEDIPDGDTLFKCAPPIRGRSNRDQLWNALEEGVIDMVVSDHSPAPLFMKHLESGDFAKAWGGISSLQFGLSVMWTEMKKRGLPITRLSEWMSAAPASLCGLKGTKGAITPGADGDLIVWNPDAAFDVEAQGILHRHRHTPYEGHRLAGVVEKTILRGNIVYDSGNFADRPCGTVLYRSD
jgi:allantoinase